MEKMKAKTLVSIAALAIASSWIQPAQAGWFSRAKTEAMRVDISPGSEVPAVRVDGLAVYSVLRSGVNGERMLRDIEVLQAKIQEGLSAYGARILFTDLLPYGGSIDSNVTGGRAAWARQITKTGQSGVMILACSHREAEEGLPASHRLILIPGSVVYSSGLEGVRRADSVGVPHYTFAIFWEFEDINNKSVARGKTTGILDIRGFPTEAMAKQIVEELVRLGIDLHGQ